MSHQLNLCSIDLYILLHIKDPSSLWTLKPNSASCVTEETVIKWKWISLSCWLWAPERNTDAFELLTKLHVYLKHTSGLWPRKQNILPKRLLSKELIMTHNYISNIEQWLFTQQQPGWKLLINMWRVDVVYDTVPEHLSTQITLNKTKVFLWATWDKVNKMLPATVVQAAVNTFKQSSPQKDTFAL